ncbi:MAG: 3',5'-cyclic-nucleotide phosphodiesterase [bacterium]
MQVRVLGCSGGIGAGLRTTSLLVNDNVLVDCGTGVADLTLDELRKIRHVFLTHAHLDHVCMLPLLIDTVFDDLQGNPLCVHASVEVLAVLKEHVFNWRLWPDFFALPEQGNAVVVAEPFQTGDHLELDGYAVTALPVEHSVPAQGYLLSRNEGKSLAFSGDTGNGMKFWDALNALPELDYLLVECAYGEEESDLAATARHYYPSALAADFAGLRHHPELHITHLKPACESEIVAEVATRLPEIQVLGLQPGDVFAL